MQQNRRNKAGFTLLEVLIALAIFAVIAVIMAVSLRMVLDTRGRLKVVDDQLRAVITAVTLLRRDITQIIGRPVKDTSGGWLPALSIPDRYRLEFTRAGYINPMQMNARSTLQRVAYSVKDHALYRTTWPVLDRAPHTKPSVKCLLQQVNYFKMDFINQNGEQVEVWSTDKSDNIALPRAIIITMELKKLGLLKLVFPIRGRSNDD